MNKLTKVETLYIPCGNKVTHFKVKCDTLNEFLEANNIDTSKEYCILQIKNN